MTYSAALIGGLVKPEFGNLDHIRIVKELRQKAEEDEETNSWNRVLLKQQVKCWCCEGYGEINCRCGCQHECPTCEGGRKLTLTAGVLSDLALYQLRDIGEELGLSIETANAVPQEPTKATPEAKE